MKLRAVNIIRVQRQIFVLVLGSLHRRVLGRLVVHGDGELRPRHRVVVLLLPGLEQQRVGVHVHHGLLLLVAAEVTDLEVGDVEEVCGRGDLAGAGPGHGHEAGGEEAEAERERPHVDLSCRASSQPRNFCVLHEYDESVG